MTGGDLIHAFLDAPRLKPAEIPVHVDSPSIRETDFSPKNEQGVVLLFGRSFDCFGIDRIIECRTRYPDCLAIALGQQIAIEFEYKASSFIRHGHDRDLVDLVVCSAEDCNLGIPTLTLPGRIDLRTLGKRRRVVERAVARAREMASVRAARR